MVQVKDFTAQLPSAANERPLSKVAKNEKFVDMVMR